MLKNTRTAALVLFAATTTIASAQTLISKVKVPQTSSTDVVGVAISDNGIVFATQTQSGVQYPLLYNLGTAATIPVTPPVGYSRLGLQALSLNGSYGAGVAYQNSGSGILPIGLSGGASGYTSDVFNIVGWNVVRATSANNSGQLGAYGSNGLYQTRGYVLGPKVGTNSRTATLVPVYNPSTHTNGSVKDLNNVGTVLASSSTSTGSDLTYYVASGAGFASKIALPAGYQSPANGFMPLNNVTCINDSNQVLVTVKAVVPSTQARP